MGCGSSSPTKQELAAAAVNPPLPKGHPILASLFGALEAEYERDAGPVVGDFLNNFESFGRGGEAELSPFGISVDDFTAWVEKVEEAIRQKATTLSWIKGVWQVGASAAGATVVAQPMPMQPQVMQPQVMQPQMMQPQAVAMPPQPAAMTVQVPQGMQGGMMLQVPTAGGPMQVQIPPGLQAGQSFQVPTAAPPPMAMAQPGMVQVAMAQPVM